MHTHAAGNNLNVDAFYPVSEQAAPGGQILLKFYGFARKPACNS